MILFLPLILFAALFIGLLILFKLVYWTCRLVCAFFELGQLLTEKLFYGSDA